MQKFIHIPESYICNLLLINKEKFHPFTNILNFRRNNYFTLSYNKVIVIDVINLYEIVMNNTTTFNLFSINSFI